MSLPWDLPFGLDISNDFTDIPGGELLTATQLVEAQVGSSMFVNPEYSDISDDELVQASSTVEVAVENKACECVESNLLSNMKFFDMSDDEFVQMPIESDSRFRNPVSVDEMASIVNEKFAKKTMDKATWAVTLFGQWGRIPLFRKPLFRKPLFRKPLFRKLTCHRTIIRHI
jgi:hypothetical protein